MEAKSRDEEVSILRETRCAERLELQGEKNRKIRKKKYREERGKESKGPRGNGKNTARGEEPLVQ